MGDRVSSSLYIAVVWIDGDLLHNFWNWRTKATTKADPGMPAERAIGIDLAGIAGNDTSVAQVVRDNDELRASIAYPQPLAANINGEEAAGPVLGADAALLAGWLQEDPERPVAFDCPIDVQGLVSPSDVDYVWQVRLRPIDHLLNAMAPLGSWLGIVVARCRCTLAYGNLSQQLGRSIFETYPKTILERLGLTAVKRWSATLFPNAPPEVNAQDEEAMGQVLDLLDNLHVGVEDQLNLSDHDLDAILCAIPLLSDEMVDEDAITEELRQAYPGMRFRAPRGFVLIPEETEVWWNTLLLDRRHLDDPPAMAVPVNQEGLAVDPPHGVEGDTCDDPQCRLYGQPVGVKQCPFCEWVKQDQQTWGGTDAHFARCPDKPADLTWNEFKAGICQQHWPT